MCRGDIQNGFNLHTRLWYICGAPKVAYYQKRELDKQSKVIPCYPTNSRAHEMVSVGVLRTNLSDERKDLHKEIVVFMALPLSSCHACVYCV